MGTLKKRELFRRNPIETPNLDVDSICISDLTNALVDLSASFSKIEIQNNKEEGRRAAKLCNELIKRCDMMKQRIKSVRVDMATKK